MVNGMSVPRFLCSKLLGPLTKIVMNQMWRANGEEKHGEERAILIAN
jgi:hypothetical protein